MEQLGQMLALELVLGFLCFFLVCVCCFFLCRLLLALAKFFEAKAKALRHDMAVNNYREDD